MPCWKSVRRASAALSLLLAACGQPVQPAAEAPAPGAVPSAPPAERLGQAPTPAVLNWNFEDAALVLREDAAEVMRLTCIPGAELSVQAESFRWVESEERMSVGAGNTVITLVATADPEGVVKGEGPIDADFVRAVGEGRKIAVNYGYQNVGPFNGPTPDAASAFVRSCGQGAG